MISKSLCFLIPGASTNLEMYCEAKEYDDSDQVDVVVHWNDVGEGYTKNISWIGVPQWEWPYETNPTGEKILNSDEGLTGTVIEHAMAATTYRISLQLTPDSMSGVGSDWSCHCTTPQKRKSKKSLIYGYYHHLCKITSQILAVLWINTKP